MKKSILLLVAVAFTLVTFLASCAKEQQAPVKKRHRQPPHHHQHHMLEGYANPNVIEAFKAW